MIRWSIEDWENSIPETMKVKNDSPKTGKKDLEDSDSAWYSGFEMLSSVSIIYFSRDWL